MSKLGTFLSQILAALAIALLFAVFPAFSSAQQKQSAARDSKPAATDKNPAQIELLETKYRFETNGDSRKEVHTRVRINNELGAHQFARLNFDFNRSFQSVEIPFVRVTHASGGTADILPSAITDNPNPAVLDYPAYHDVRVKSVRILGLQPDDLLEYRVITTTTRHPLAPDFWLDHTFDHSGVVTEEHFQVTLPASVLAAAPLIVVANENVRQQLEYRLNRSRGCGLCVPPDPDTKIDPSLIDPLVIARLTAEKRKRRVKSAEIAPNQAARPNEEPLPPAEWGKVQVLVTPLAGQPAIEGSRVGADAQVTYKWQRTATSQESGHSKDMPPSDEQPDIEIGKVSTWNSLSYRLYVAFSLPKELPEGTVQLSRQITGKSEGPGVKAERINDFVSQKIKTVDLPLGITGFKLRPLEEIVSSGYATAEDKFFLFDALAKSADLEATAALASSSKKIQALVVSPAAFSHLLIVAGGGWCDPTLEVAPFGLLPASYRGSAALFLGVDDGPLVDRPSTPMTFKIPENMPFPSTQKVFVGSALSSDGTLKAQVKYSLRGDNELLLRLAFHKTPKEKWKDVAQMLALSDGFRGQITNVTASDPYATKEPFTVEYEISQPKFVDWSKKTVRIPAILPLPGLPDPPPAAQLESKKPIELGTPLAIDLEATIELPAGATAQAPIGTTVNRDYATFTSKYSAQGTTLHASRSLHFLSSELPASRATDFNAFLHAVQSDQTQFFTLQSSQDH